MLTEILFEQLYDQQEVCSTSSKIKKKQENKWNLSFRKFSLKIESQKNVQSHIHSQMVINWILIWGSKMTMLLFFNKWFIYHFECMIPQNGLSMNCDTVSLILLENEKF